MCLVSIFINFKYFILSILVSVKYLIIFLNRGHCLAKLIQFSIYVFGTEFNIQKEISKPEKKTLTMSQNLKLIKILTSRSKFKTVFIVVYFP